MGKPRRPDDREDGEVIYCMWITRNGKRIYRANGRPWRIVIRRRDP